MGLTPKKILFSVMWIFYAIFSQALLSVVNFIDKLMLNKYIRDSSIIVIFSSIMAVVTSIVIFLFRGFPTFSLQQTLLILLAGIGTELALIPYFKALDTDDPSRVIPLMQSTAVFTLLLSFLFLGEVLSLKQYIGFAAILFSGFVLTLTKVEKRIFKLRPSFWYIMLSSLLFAVTAVIFKFVVEVQNFWDTVAYENLGIGFGGFLILAWPGYAKRFIDISKSLPVKGWIVISLSEAFLISHRLFLFFAISLASVSLVSVLAGFQPVFLLLFGIILSHWFPNIIKEEINRKVIGLKVAAIILIFFGLALIYF